MRNFRSDSYFNPRSLVGNDQSQSSLLLIQEISIHVPSWGTTLKPFCTARFAIAFQSTFPRGERLPMPSISWILLLFQSTFPRGERQYRSDSVSPGYYFNPRSLVGNDGIFLRFSILAFISIHVPSWGTTPRTISTAWRSFISIHVPSWGTTANFHKYSLFFYAINIIFLLFIIPSLFSLVLFMLLF